MTIVRQIITFVSLWLDAVAAATVRALESVTTKRTAQLIERTDGAFALRTPQQSDAKSETAQIADGVLSGPQSLKAALAGARVELVLQPRRFLFRPLELPRQASEFLQGIMRAQIDRLTPWSADEAAFGASAPRDIENQRIAVTVAATARDRLMPFVEAIVRLGAQSVAVSTVESAGPGAATIRIYDHKAASAIDAHRVRSRLRNALVALLVLTGITLGASAAIDRHLQTQRDEIVQLIAARRNAIRAQLHPGSDATLVKLERRKYRIMPTVLALETLSKVLPDNTYVTELRIEGSKMQIIGVTQEAPSLIRLIEQAQQFRHAVFFAPTTRSPSDPGDRFHIEAQTQPVTAPPS